MLYSSLAQVIRVCGQQLPGTQLMQDFLFATGDMLEVFYRKQIQVNLVDLTISTIFGPSQSCPGLSKDFYALALLQLHYSTPPTPLFT